MMELDATRCRLRLTARDIAEVPEIRDARPLPGWARETLDTVADPGLRIVVRIFTSGQPVEHSVWATPRVAVIGGPTDDGKIELSATEPVLIPYAIAQIVGFRRRPAPPGRYAIRVPLSVYLSVQKQVGTSAGPDVRPRESASTEAILAALFRRRLISWRATSAWRDGSGERVTRNVQVTDAGEAGLWQIGVEEPDSSDPTLLIEPSAARAVWASLTSLLPSRR